MKKLLLATTLVVAGLSGFNQSAQAIPVDLELILATDTSGSVDGTDFALRRSGISAAFRNADVIAAIESGAIGSIAVALWDFGTNVTIALDWVQISSAAEANAYADAVDAAGRGNGGIDDGQAQMLRDAATAITTNGFEATRSIVDITSEGVQSGEGCVFTSPDCQATRDARDTFLAAGGTAVNAIWMEDRTFFGLGPGYSVDAFEYGALSVIGGDGAFQVFAQTNADFEDAIREKLIREITDPGPDDPTVSEPASFGLIALGLISLVLRSRRRVPA